MSTVWRSAAVYFWNGLRSSLTSLDENNQIVPPVLEERTARLLIGVVMLLRQHQVNKRGQCRYCSWTRRTWRLWHRGPQCMVYLGLDLTPLLHTTFRISFVVFRAANCYRVPFVSFC